MLQSNQSKHSVQLQSQRLKLVIFICMIGILSALIVNWAIKMNWYTQSILTLALLGLGIAYWMLNFRRLALATDIMLWTLAISLSLLAGLNNGLLDKAMLCFPALLIFSALFSTERQFWAMFAFLLVVVTALGLAQLSGWQQHVSVSVTSSTLLNVLIILSITGFTLRYQAFDLRNALKKLALENERYRASEAKATYLAQYDALTGLPNRSLCEDRFNIALNHLKRRGNLAALLFIDLDNFKTINDSLGHAIGDKVLQTTAKSLRQCLRSSDTACRFGGDEFLVLLTDIDNVRQVENIATKILLQLNNPVEMGGHQLQTTVSIGIALAPQDGGDFGSYCKNADIAMYKAKADGKNLYRFFDSSMNTLSDERFNLIKDLRLAVDHDELRLFYQPKMNLQTNQLVGAEALIRWQHPTRGLLAPADFIELAEETGLIVGMGKWVLRQACRQCKLWVTAGHTNFEMAVNLSSVQFARGNLTAQVEKALQHADLDGKHLELELTESLLLGDAENIRSQLESLKKYGVSFSIDDFGTGYSNLSYLSKFNLDAIKIDQSFVRKILDSKQDLNIIIAIINIAKSLELITVAEGIEDQLVLDRLTELGCQLGQGYHWSRPIPAELFSKLLANHGIQVESVASNIKSVS